VHYDKYIVGNRGDSFCSLVIGFGFIFYSGRVSPYSFGNRDYPADCMVDFSCNTQTKIIWNELSGKHYFIC